MTDAHPKPHEPDALARSSADGGCCGSERPAPPGAPAAEPRRGRAYRVRGMDCAEEVAVLKQAVGPLVGGGGRLAFDVVNGRMTVADEAGDVPDEAIVTAVAGTGMSAVPWKAQAATTEADGHRRRQALFTALSGACVLIGMVLHVVLAGGFAGAWKLLGGHAGQPMPWPEIAAYLGAVVLGGRFVVVKAWHAARNLRPDMHLLMTVAVIGAAVIGDWFEAATVTFLFALSLALESWSVGRARRAIAALLDLAPPVARLLRPDGTEVVVPVAELKPGERFVVPAGERIPLDGRIVAGSSAVNQAPITGESVPVEKERDAEVFAGTINGDGALTIEATKTAEDTTLARIIHMVEDAHARRAPSEQWVERFARVYTPAVMLLALLVFLLPPVLFGGPWSEWFYRALVLLVIACPCALVISTPVSIVASLASAARAGVLVKGGAFIELPAHLQVIAMDKTGTITRGEPEVVRVIPLNSHTEAELLARAAALEARSTHPLARAILRYAEQQGLVPEPAVDVQMLKGKGLTGTFEGEPFWLGSHRYVVERGQDSPEVARQAEALEADGKTVIVIGNPRHVCGLIAAADTIRPEARKAVQELHAVGVPHVVMLTGDNRVTAEAIAREVGIDEVHAELLPEGKVEEVEKLVARYGTVAMVGDGVNDAPALARASLGIAMGAIGSDAAIETADVALMTDDVSKVAWLVHHAKRTLAIIRQNIMFSLGVKALFVVLTFAGLASLWGAIAADVGASLLVVANALRLLRATAPSRRTLNVLLAALLGICCAVVAQPGIARADALDTARAGIAAKERRQFPLAIQLIDEALREGEFTAELKGILLYSRGGSYNALGIRDRALSDFDAAIRLLPQFPNSYVNRGLIWVDRREYDRALEDFLYAQRLAPDDPLISNNLGGVYLMKGDLAQALESYDRAIRLKPDYADAYLNRAEVLVAAEEYERAMADYDQAIRLTPTLAEAIQNRGLLHLKLGALDKAIADFGMAIRLRPADAALLTNRATALALIGKYDEAFADFDRALQIEPGKPEIYLGRGRSRLFAGDVPASIDDFIAAVRLRPDDPNPAIWLHIARVHSGVDDRQELADNAAGVVASTWPKAVLDLYLGKLDSDSIRSAAAEGPPKDRARRKCEAEFYLAEFAVHNGELSKGRRLLEEVSLQCRQYTVLYNAAQAELRFATQ